MSLPFFRLFIALITLQFAPAAGTIGGIVIKGGTTIPQPLQNARVELTGPALTLVTRTGSNGRSTFANLLPGAYRIEVTRDGFIRQAFSKRVVLGGGQNTGD
jgi:hypothetical protein